MKAILLFFLVLPTLLMATPCGEFVYNKHGMLKKYVYLPLNISENTKKHGTMSSSGNTTEASTAFVDPGVYTGMSTGSAQSISSWGQCSFLKVIGVTKAREQYIEQNMEDIKDHFARGEGEHIKALAFLSQCPQNKEQEFATKMQSNLEKFIDFKSNEAIGFAKEIDELVLCNSVI